jgi:hypothetical protein
MVRAIHFIHYYLAPAFLWFVQYATRTGSARLVQRVADELKRARYGISYKEMCEKCNVSLQQRNEALAILDEKIHYEKWKKMRPGLEGEMVPMQGAPHIVVVWGKKVDYPSNLDDLRPNEARIQGGQDVLPPPAIQKLIAEKKDNDIDLTDLEKPKNYVVD